jgi:hypothetical protein
MAVTSTIHMPQPVRQYQTNIGLGSLVRQALQNTLCQVPKRLDCADLDALIRAAGTSKQVLGTRYILYKTIISPASKRHTHTHSIRTHTYMHVHMHTHMRIYNCASINSAYANTHTETEHA